MSPDALRKILDKNYKVLDFVDLGQVVAKPSLGFKAISDQYKEIFDNNERIVFYANGTVGQRTLDYLKYATNVFDISKCFILVCCPDHDCVVDNKYDIEFFTANIDSVEFDDKLVISTDSLCVMPHFSVEFFNNGAARTCCYIKETMKGANSSAPVKELFFSEKMNSLRKSLLSGVKPQSCQQCWSNESAGLTSLRKWRNKTHKKEFLTQLLDDPQIRSCSLRVSTTCNFKCRICSYSSSSLWAEESLKYETDPAMLNKIKKSIEINKWFDKNDVVTEEIKQLCETLDFIDIYGGEPLLIKQFKTILQHCIDIGSAKKQTLHFNTNASLFPVDTFKLMNHFREIHISLSIDNIGARFELERGGIWSEIEKNINKFLDLDPSQYKVNALIVVSNLNLLYLDELINWADKKKLPIDFQMLEEPLVYNYKQVTQSVIDLAVCKYLNHPNKFLHSLATNLKKTDAVDSTDWIKKTKNLDMIRNQSIMYSHPELALAMGYN